MRNRLHLVSTPRICLFLGLFLDDRSGVLFSFICIFFFFLNAITFSLLENHFKSTHSPIYVLDKLHGNFLLRAMYKVHLCYSSSEEKIYLPSFSRTKKNRKKWASVVEGILTYHEWEMLWILPSERAQNGHITFQVTFKQLVHT